MRKSVFITITSAVIAASSVLCSCAQNDGEIGYLYGVWSLNDFYSDDGYLAGEECAGYSIKFQSNIVQYVEVLPYYDSNIFTGTWQATSDSIFMSFPYSTNPTESGDSKKVFFPVFPSAGFKVNTLTNSVLDISHTTSEGKEFRYYFKKLN